MSDTQSPSSTRKFIEIYTDGACSGNPGPGGWGTILRFQGKERELSGGNLETTNNQMELQAAIEGLKALKEPCDVELYTDSQYLRQGITQWIQNCKRKGWITAQKKPENTPRLWEELDALAQTHTVKWHWLKGHAGHPENERCDELARNEIDRLRG